MHTVLKILISVVSRILYLHTETDDRPPFTSTHDSSYSSKIAGVSVVWTRPAVSPTRICAVVN